MLRFTPLASAAALAVVMATATTTLAHQAAVTYQQIAVIPVAGLTSFDISFVERSSQTYYLADRSHKAVDFFNAATNDVESRVTGFVGPSTSNDTAGPNGIVVVGDQHELWAGDGDSTVKVIDLRSRTIVATISTGGTNRADEMAYDQKDKILVVANDAEIVPFVSFIDTRTRIVVGKVQFPDATNGLEQPVWDPATHLFYLSVPRLGADPTSGGIAVLDPRTRSLVRTRPVTDCEPAGLALGPSQHLLLGCSGDGIAAWQAQLQVMDARTGAIVKVITGIGGADEVWFNPGDKHYYVAARFDPSGPKLGIIDARTDTLIQTVATATNSHSVAADPINNHIFVPLKGTGIGVYAAVDEDSAGNDERDSDDLSE